MFTKTYPSETLIKELSTPFILQLVVATNVATNETGADTVACVGFALFHCLA